MSELQQLLGRLDLALLNDELTFTLLLLAVLAMTLASWPRKEQPRGP